MDVMDVEELQTWLTSVMEQAIKPGDDHTKKSCDIMIENLHSKTKTTFENYFIAKSNSNCADAASNLIPLIEPLYRDLSIKSQICNALNMTSTINQLREELAILLNELKSHYLKLKASSAPASIISRQNQSVVPSPMLSPRNKIAPEDRTSSRDSVSKMSDGHLLTSSKIIFYDNVFKLLPVTIQELILTSFIENAENQFEACRLMMLRLAIPSDELTDEKKFYYANRLLQTLIELAEPTKKQQPPQTSEEKILVHANPRQQLMCRYARSLLVLDAIPLALRFVNLSNVNASFNVDHLYDQALRLYSDQCLENSSAECDLGELHEGVRKTITAKIIGIDIHTGARDPAEDIISSTLSQLNHSMMDAYLDEEDSDKLNKLRTILVDKSLQSGRDYTNSIFKLIKSIQHDDNQESPHRVATPPPKARGRPKKKPIQTVSDDTSIGTKLNETSKSKLLRIVAYSLIECMFNNCTTYLRSTKSRILVDNELPLHQQQETIIHESNIKKESPVNEIDESENLAPTQAKRVKTNDDTRQDKQITKYYRYRGQSIDQSPLNSEQSKKMDRHVLWNLMQARIILDFLNSNDQPIITNIWSNFRTTYLIESNWFRRFLIDSSIMLGLYEDAIDLLKTSITQLYPPNVKIEPTVEDSSRLETSSPSSGTSDMRRLTQLLSCYLKSDNQSEILVTIENLISTMKSCELLASDEYYSNGNIIVEYVIGIDGMVSFLFLDSLSIMRYCSDILMNILEFHVSTPNLVSDTAIGHTIVLSQFDWPKEAKTYTKCIDWIRANKPKSTTPQYLSASTKFTYPEFFHFVRNPSIIEDFVALLSQSYTLDVKDTDGSVSSMPANQHTRSSNVQSTGPSPGKSGSGTRSAKAITTRGVNKTFKEDLKVAMIAQMKCSTVLISLDMIYEFIRLSVLPYLNDVRMT